MQSLSGETNQNNPQTCSYQCEFNYIGCKFTTVNKQEMLQHYRTESHNHLLLFQYKLRLIESVNSEIRKDYHKLFKIISNIQQFKKFPDILPKPSKEKNNDEFELNKNRYKKKDKEKREIFCTNYNNINFQAIKNKLFSDFNTKQKIYEVIGYKRKRSEEEKPKEKNIVMDQLNKNEEIILSSVEDDNNNDNNFLHEDGVKHQIFINKSEDNEDNKIESNYNTINNNIKKKKEIFFQTDAVRDKNINVNKEKASKPKKVSFIVQNENNNEEMNDLQIKRFLSETEKNSMYNFDLMKKDFIEVCKKSPEPPEPILDNINLKPKNEIFDLIEKKEKEIIKEKSPVKFLNINQENVEKNKNSTNQQIKDTEKYEIISESENNENKNDNNMNENKNIFIYGNDDDYSNNILIQEEKEKQIKKMNNENNDNNDDISLNELEIEPEPKKEKNIMDIISKIDYNENILNNKKVQWEATLKKITGWFAIGVSEKFDSVSENNQNFILSNQNIISNVNDNKKVKINLNLKEGDNLVCLYSHKFKHLKIKKGEEENIIENIISQSGRPLVPTAFFEKKSDQIIFHNFKILAEYKK